MLSIRGRFRAFEFPGLVQPLSPVVAARALGADIARLWVDDHNLVVDPGIASFRALLAGAFGQPTIYGRTILPAPDVGGGTPDAAKVSSLFVQRMQITTQSDPSEPAPDDSALEGSPQFTFQSDDPTPTLTVTYPDENTVRFSAVLGPTQGNGLIFTEEGLFTAEGDLFARALFGRRATGQIEFTGNPVNGDTVSVNDGNIVQTFEFRTNPSNFSHVQIGGSEFQTMNNLSDKISTSSIEVTVQRLLLRSNPTIAVENKVAGTQGNVPLTRSANAPLLLEGMSGGVDPREKTPGLGVQLDHDIIIQRESD